MKLHPLYSSSSGNLYYLETEKTKILIDIGVTYKKINEALEELHLNITDIDAILITHEHSDHIKGIKTLSKKIDIPIYTCIKTKDYLHEHIANDNYNITGLEYEELFKINELEITPFEISHDAIMPCGYYISDGISSISFATDLGIVSDNIIKYLSKSNSIVLESNYDKIMLEYGPYPYPTKQRIKNEFGHLSNHDTAELMNTLLNEDCNKKFILSHMSKNNNNINIATDTISNVLINNNHKINCYSFATKDLSLEGYII